MLMSENASLKTVVSGFLCFNLEPFLLFLPGVLSCSYIHAGWMLYWLENNKALEI